MMISNISPSYFHKYFISLFVGLFNDETDLRVKGNWLHLRIERGEGEDGGLGTIHGQP